MREAKAPHPPASHSRAAPIHHNWNIGKSVRSHWKKKRLSDTFLVWTMYPDKLMNSFLANIFRLKATFEQKYWYSIHPAYWLPVPVNGWPERHWIQCRYSGNVFIFQHVQSVFAATTWVIQILANGLSPLQPIQKLNVLDNVLLLSSVRLVSPRTRRGNECWTVLIMSDGQNKQVAQDAVSSTSEVCSSCICGSIHLFVVVKQMTRFTLLRGSSAAFFNVGAPAAKLLMPPSTQPASVWPVFLLNETLYPRPSPLFSSLPSSSLPSPPGDVCWFVHVVSLTFSPPLRGT